MMDSSETFFVDYIDNNNISDELNQFYSIINEEEINIKNIIIENKRKYKNINLNSFENLSETYEDIIKEIKKIYSFISPNSLNDEDKVIENQKIINILINYINQLKSMINVELRELRRENKLRQEKIKHINYNAFDKETLLKILEKYNSLVYSMYNIDKDVFKEYKKHLMIKKELNKIYRLINIEVDYENKSRNALEELNNKTSKELKKIYDKTIYLEDLMLEGSKHINEFVALKKYLSKLTAYDDSNYLEVNKVYNFLVNNQTLNNKFKQLEDLFINEREYARKEQDFIYEKTGVRNLKISLDYISANYMDILDDYSKKIITELYDSINSNNCIITECYKKLKKVVNRIWEKTSTEVYSYKQSDDFCFICTNNQFIDEKYQAILITQKMLNRVENYSNYQIGFICNFNDNILYVTEKDDIMEVEYNDMSNLKTPKQIEQEFLNFKICDRIALNGYITSISAVYLINDGDFLKYKKAVELANQYNLPLIVLKKDN